MSDDEELPKLEADRLGVVIVLIVSLFVGVVGVLLVLTDDAGDGDGDGDGDASTAAGCTGELPARGDQVADAGFSPGFSILGRAGGELDAELAGIAATGARWLRVDVAWSSIEEERGEYEWAHVDRVVDAARTCGLEILGILDFTPEWARPDDTTDKHPPTDPDDFGEFARTAVEHFGTRIQTWEIWNEPNLSVFWQPRPDPAGYTEILEVAYSAIKAVDPDATVLTGGLSPADDATDGETIAPVTFLTEMYAAGASGHFDAVAHHPYTYPLLPLDPVGEYNENAFGGVTPQLYEVMRANGDGDKEIWGTEIGVPTIGGIGPELVAASVSQAYQAWREWSFTGPLIWYSFRDSSDDPADLFENFGLVTTDGTPKGDALAAYEEVIRG